MRTPEILPLCLCLALAACASAASPEDTKMANALSDQGKSLLASGKKDEARDLYASAVKRDPQNARAWNGLGVADDLLKKPVEAREAYQRAIELAPDDLTAINNLAHLETATGHAEAAVALLEPHANDPATSETLKQNLAAARQAVQTKQALSKTYADLGSFPTEGMAQAHAAEAQSLLGRDAKNITLTVVPEVKIAGGTPLFTVKATGKSPQEICDILNPEAFPCVPHGK